MQCGFQIRQRQRKVDAQVVERYRSVAVAHASDNMARMFHAGPSLRPLHAGGTLVGPALTVKVRPGDNLLVHKALNMAEPGDVIVVDAGGDMTNAIIGELMLEYAKTQGVAGIIINGAVRDIAAIRAATLPVYAAGITHRGPYKDGPGEINGPIAIQGMVVQPGDLMLGDENGLLCIPYDATAIVYEGVLATRKREQRIIAEIRNGIVDRSWVEKALVERGCKTPPESQA